MQTLEYHRPRSLDEALELAAAIPRASFIAGGTDLMVQLRKRRTAAPPAMISLRAVAELARIEDGELLRIGAAAPLTDVAEHPAVARRFPALVESILVLGSRQIRNVATLGGNLCNGSPAADTAPPLLVHGAEVELRGASGTRVLPLEELFVGPGKTARRPGELLTAVLLRDRPGARAKFMRRGRLKMDLAIVCVAVLLELEGARCVTARVAAGAVAPVPLRLKGVESILANEHLDGDTLDEDTLQRVRERARAEIRPISDLRGSADYRRQLTGVLVARAIESLLGGEGQNGRARG